MTSAPPEDDFIMPEPAAAPAARPQPKPPAAPLPLPQWAHRILAFDTETTGTDEDARILEFGAVLWEGGVRVRDWSIPINPGIVDFHDPRVVEALAVNGFDVGKLESAKTFEQSFDEIRSIMSQGNVRVAHNSRFDLRMIRQEYERVWAAGNRLTLKNQEAPGKRFYTLDTLALDLFLNPEHASRSLENVAARWGVTDWEKHRAKGDADACGRVLLAMAPKLPVSLGDVVLEVRSGQKKHDEILAARKTRDAAASGGAK